jgi:hypothetical protein
MLMKPPRCWRNRSDCEPLHSVEGLPPNMTEEDFIALEMGELEPDSFICAGCVQPEGRILQQDAYRLCFKNDVGDEMTDNDEQDLTHLMAVISQALAIIASRRINSGTIDVMTMQGQP